MPNWDYQKMPEVVGGSGIVVKTEEELKNAVFCALKSEDMSVINVIVPRDDTTSLLTRMQESGNA